MKGTSPSQPAALRQTATRCHDAGKAELVRPNVPRDKLHELIAALPPCMIGMEACSGAHHWARLFQAAGHTVRLIAPKFSSRPTA
jgi:transposase